MSLAIETEKGLQYDQKEVDTANIIASKLNCDIHLTPEPCEIDAICSRHGVIVSLLEIKNRNKTYEQLLNYGSYLISKDKLKTGRRFSGFFNVPFFLFVATSDQRIIYWKIAEKGHYHIPLSFAETKTRNTCNGEYIATRENAFLDYDWAKVLI